MQESEIKYLRKPKPFLSEENDFFDFYIGVNSGKRLYGKIYDAKKSIKIISPFLTDKMTEELSNRSKEIPIDIFLITTVSEKSNNKHLSAIKNCFRCIRGSEYRVFYNSVFFIGELLHEKIYIIDDEIAFAGSLNFTNRGINDNIESVIMFKKTDMVQKIITYFNKLHTTESIPRWEISDLDEMIRSKQIK